MECHSSGDIGVAGNKRDQCPHFRLTGWEGTRAGLVRLLPPVAWEIAVEVQALFVRLDFDGHAVPVFKRSLGQQPVISPARFRGFPSNQEPWLFRMLFPRSVWVL